MHGPFQLKPCGIRETHIANKQASKSFAGKSIYIIIVGKHVPSSAVQSAYMKSGKRKDARKEMANAENNYFGPALLEKVFS